jgi:hypothetical protein
MDPFLGYGLMQGGSALLGWLGGRGRRNKAQEDYERGWDRLAGTADDEPCDPWTIMAAGRRSVASDVAARGAQVDRELGLDTGQGKGALWADLLSRQSAMLPGLLRERDLEKYRRAYDVASQLFGSASDRWMAVQ